MESAGEDGFLDEDMGFRKEDGYYYIYEISPATFACFSFHESSNDVKYYLQYFGNKHLGIITKDLPMVGYKSVANRSDPDCWLFLMRYSLTRINSRERWIMSVLGEGDITIEDVYKYYSKQVSKRPSYSRKSIIDTILDLKKLVNKRF